MAYDGQSIMCIGSWVEGKRTWENVYVTHINNKNKNSIIYRSWNL